MQLILSAVMIIAGAALIVGYFYAKKRAAELRRGLEDFTSRAEVYEAEVLGVKTESVKLPSGKQKKLRAMNIRFRIEEQKKTVIHRCTERFYKSYAAGDKVQVYFIEDMPADRSMLKGDNYPERFGELCGKAGLPAAASGAALIAAGIILMLR